MHAQSDYTTCSSEVDPYCGLAHWQALDLPLLLGGFPLPPEHGSAGWPARRRGAQAMSTGSLVGTIATGGTSSEGKGSL